jgi:hypothetical protein
MYQRPMLEDGVIEFESYYVAGEFEAHPALGRMAYLVRPDGVKLHRLTDAEWESTGLSPDNESPLQGAAATVSLKENDWNQFRVAVAGDTLTLTVNGTEIGRHTLQEPRAQRFFGLFRYSDQNKCRVRKVVYRGQWPKEIPAVADQDLAYPAAGVLPSAELKGDVQDFDLTRNIAEFESAGLATFGPADRITTTEHGIRLWLKNAAGGEQWPGIVLRQPISGDFDVTLDFQQLKLSKVNEGWGNGLSLKIIFEAPERWAEVGVYLDGNGQQQLRSTLAHRQVSGTMNYDGRSLTGTYESGRMRMVRLGAMLHCLFAEKGSDVFRLLESFPVGDAAVREFRLESVCSDPVGTVDSVASKLTLIRPAPAKNQ